ncbi:MAG: cytochrome c3 family protein [Calditrichia bacterium]
MLTFLLAGCAMLVVLIGNHIYSGNVMSNGPLSSKHANFENDCAACHSTPSISEGIVAAVEDTKCLTCHNDAMGELKSYEFAVHYMYRSHDKRRTVVKDSVQAHEMTCANCHGEHYGRDGQLTHVAKSICQSCHQYDSFNSGHPEFQFAREEIPDQANLKFTHAFHVKELQRRGGVSTTEEACASCHQTDVGGKSFKPIRFESACSECHLGPLNPTPTAELAVQIRRRSTVPGVQSLKTIQSTNAPGNSWARFANPNEYDEYDNTIVKQLLHHKDPWILFNLRLLRKQLFPQAGLADLLASDGKTVRQESAQIYHEAIAALETQVRELRLHPSPVVHEDLERVADELVRLKKLLANPGDSQFDFRKFELGRTQLAPAFEKDSTKLTRYKAFVDVLTAECQTCHLVENATILRVQKDQQILTRAEFRHDAHVVQNNCLDCHQGIDFAGLAELTEIPAEADNAGIQNIPVIATCQGCHTPQAASNKCMTCHKFHPSKSHLSQLHLKVEQTW